MENRIKLEIYTEIWDKWLDRDDEANFSEYLYDKMTEYKSLNGITYIPPTIEEIKEIFRELFSQRNIKNMF